MVCIERVGVGAARPRIEDDVVFQKRVEMSSIATD